MPNRHRIIQGEITLRKPSWLRHWILCDCIWYNVYPRRRTSLLNVYNKSNNNIYIKFWTQQSQQIPRTPLGNCLASTERQLNGSLYFVINVSTRRSVEKTTAMKSNGSLFWKSGSVLHADNWAIDGVYLKNIACLFKFCLARVMKPIVVLWKYLGIIFWSSEEMLFRGRCIKGV